MSRHVRTLEVDFGCRLFAREGRGLRLTEPGPLLLPGLQQGFAALVGACASLRSPLLPAPGNGSGRSAVTESA